MKTLPFLLLVAVLVTCAAWISVQEISEARPISSVEVPLAKTERAPTGVRR